jgi:hypothetical protein
MGCFTAADGRQLKRSTRETNRDRALAIAKEWEQLEATGREGYPTPAAAASLLEAECAKLKSECATLQRLLDGAAERRGSKGQLKVRAASRQEFGEVAKLKGEIAWLKNEIAKHKAALQQEPDVAKLRKKNIASKSRWHRCARR